MGSLRTSAAVGLAAVLVAGGCGNVPASFDEPLALEEIRGTWAADRETKGEDQTRLRFGTAEGAWRGAWITASERGVALARFRYEFRRGDREDRYELDMRGFDSGALRGTRMYGLLEWVEPGELFRLDLEPGDGPQARPKRLSQDAKVFRRVSR